MTSRERWTVYPLLFLTLGMTLRDKLLKTVSTERVFCRTLVVGDQGKPGGSPIDLVAGHFGPAIGLFLRDPTGRLTPWLSVPLLQAPRSGEPPSRTNAPGTPPKADPAASEAEPQEGQKAQAEP